MISTHAQFVAERAWDHHKWAQTLTVSRREETRHAHGMLLGAIFVLVETRDDAAYLNWIRDTMAAMEQHHAAQAAAAEAA